MLSWLMDTNPMLVLAVALAGLCTSVWRSATPRLTWMRSGVIMTWIVVAISALSTWLLPSVSRWISLGAILLFFLLPMQLGLQVAFFERERRFAEALLLHRVLRVLHPFPSMRYGTQRLLARTLYQRGDTVGAAAVIASSPLSASVTPLVRELEVASFSNAPEKTLALSASSEYRAALERNPSLFASEMEALARLGRRDALIARWTEIEALLERTTESANHRIALTLWLLELTGHPEWVDTLCAITPNVYRGFDRDRIKQIVATSGFDREEVDGEEAVLRLAYERCEAALRASSRVAMPRALWITSLLIVLSLVAYLNIAPGRQSRLDGLDAVMAIIVVLIFGFYIEFALGAWRFLLVFLSTLAAGTIVDACTAHSPLRVDVASAAVALSSVCLALFLRNRDTAAPARRQLNKSMAKAALLVLAWFVCSAAFAGMSRLLSAIAMVITSFVLGLLISKSSDQAPR